LCRQSRHDATGQNPVIITAHHAFVETRTHARRTRATHGKILVGRPITIIVDAVAQFGDRNAGLTITIGETVFATDQLALLSTRPQPCLAVISYGKIFVECTVTIIVYAVTRLHIGGRQLGVAPQFTRIVAPQTTRRGAGTLSTHALGAHGKVLVGRPVTIIVHSVASLDGWETRLHITP